MEKFTPEEIKELRGLVKFFKTVDVLWKASDKFYASPSPIENESINQDELEGLKSIVNLMRKVDKLERQVLILAKETKVVVDIEEKQSTNVFPTKE